MTTLSDFTAKDITGAEVSLADYAGKVVVVVNVASKCGFTPQYEGLQKLYETYADQGLEILGFPCNQFMGQEPGSEEDIASFCDMNYGVTFPMFSKIDVNGSDAHPLYKWLRSEATGKLNSMVKWNFTKFLVGRDGKVIKRISTQTTPAEMVADIEAALAA